MKDWPIIKKKLFLNIIDDKGFLNFGQKNSMYNIKIIPIIGMKDGCIQIGKIKNYQSFLKSIWLKILA